MKNIIYKIVLIILLTALSNRGNAQFCFPIVGGSSMGLGGITTTIQDQQASIQNPAILGFARHSEIGIGLQQNYLVKGLTHKNIFASYNSPQSGGWGLDYHHFGDEGYYEQQLSAAYGLATGRKMAIGIMLNYLNSGTGDAHYASQNMMTFGLGAQYYPTEKTTIGVSVFNPASIKFNTENHTRIPTQLKAGVSYQLCEELTGHIEVEQRMTIKTITRIGLEYNYNQRLLARAGFCTYPSAWSFGVGYKSTKYAIDLGVQTHMQLGISSQISAHYKF